MLERLINASSSAADTQATALKSQAAERMKFDAEHSAIERACADERLRLNLEFSARQDKIVADRIETAAAARAQQERDNMKNMATIMGELQRMQAESTATMLATLMGPQQKLDTATRCSGSRVGWGG